MCMCMTHFCDEGPIWMKNVNKNCNFARRLHSAHATTMKIGCGSGKMCMIKQRIKHSIKPNNNKYNNNHLNWIKFEKPKEQHRINVLWINFQNLFDIVPKTQFDFEWQQFNSIFM